MKQAGRMELNQGWTLQGRGPRGERIGPLKATVPGHVHTDLMREALIPDPFWRDQALESQWVESFTWEYELEFDWNGQANPDDAPEIVFEGLDTLATVKLNGHMIGRAQNMFIAHRFPLGNLLRAGVNVLQVAFTPIPEYVADKEVGKYPSLFSQDRVFIRRMQCTFGWDWVHRLVSYGIWRPVYVECKPHGSLQDVVVRTLEATEQFAVMQWEAEMAIKAKGTRLSLELYDTDDREVWSQQADVIDVDSGCLLSGKFTLERPMLWWPVGCGEPHLYRFVARLLSEVGDVLDERSLEIGIRTVQVEQIPDERGSSFTIVVNGRRIFAKGGNWVPADPFPSRVTPTQYDHLLRSLADGHMNMLRVWGGGTYELPDFWSACNRYGIMVSQDFLMACAKYPEEEEWFRDEMRQEVKAAVKELRNHPSLVFWCGDNELAMSNNPEDDYPGKRIFAEVTAPICAELDPGRPCFPTSPFEGRPFNSEDAGDCHVSAWYDPAFYFTDMSDYRERIVALRGRFLSESANAGAPPLASLLKMMTMDDVLDPSGAIWEFRTKDNPYNGLDELTHYRMVEACALRIFGESTDPLLHIRKLGYVHYEYARLTAEHLRRRKFDSSGLLFWMYNDCWPASGWAMIDYYGLPKAGYYGAKAGFKPIMASIEDRGDHVAVWLVNDTLEEVRGKLRMRTVRTGGGVPLYAEETACMIGSNEARPVAELAKAAIGLIKGARDVVLQAVWEADRDNWPQSRTVYFDALPKDLELPSTGLNVEWEPAVSSHGTIRVTAERYARVVTIEGDLLPEDNYFDLLPGETIDIEYRTKPGQSLSHKPIVTCWNGRP